MPNNTKRRFDDEFKRRAVRISYSSERSIKDVADSLGINVSMLHRWRKRYTPEGEVSQMAQQQDQQGRLRSRIAELAEEHDILKKASAYFAKNLTA